MPPFCNKHKVFYKKIGWAYQCPECVKEQKEDVEDENPTTTHG